MSQPDLFVVCKNCGSEVSPYVTECPYCGQRVRKRAPKLDRSTAEAPPRPRRRVKLPRLRPDEIAGIAPDTRPYGTVGLLIASLVLTVIYAADPTLDIGAVVVPLEESVWRWFVTPFVHGDLLGYQFVALVSAAIFGVMLERRFGTFAVVAAFVLAGAAGAALAVVSGVPPLFEGDPPIYAVLGANGAALGLLCAWLVEDRVAARRGDERGNDRLGVYVIGVVLVLLSVAVPEANVAAAAGGALAGSVLGLVLPLLPRRAPR